MAYKEPENTLYRKEIRRIGVISDTHGLIRLEALEVLHGSELIIHAGDIGGSRVLESLGAIAPVAAVRGNMDGEWAETLPETEVVKAGEHLFYVIHDLAKLDLDPASAGFSAVICGHSHRPSIGRIKGVLLLNPGSAGPKRFELQPSVAIIDIRDGNLEPLLIEVKTGILRQSG